MCLPEMPDGALLACIQYPIHGVRAQRRGKNRAGALTSLVASLPLHSCHHHTCIQYAHAHPMKCVRKGRGKNRAIAALHRLHHHHHRHHHCTYDVTSAGIGQLQSRKPRGGGPTGARARDPMGPQRPNGRRVMSPRICRGLLAAPWRVQPSMKLYI